MSLPRSFDLASQADIAPPATSFYSAVGFAQTQYGVASHVVSVSGTQNLGSDWLVTVDSTQDQRVMMYVPVDLSNYKLSLLRVNGTSAITAYVVPGGSAVATVDQLIAGVQTNLGATPSNGLSPGDDRWYVFEAVGVSPTLIKYTVYPGNGGTPPTIGVTTPLAPTETFSTSAVGFQTSGQLGITAYLATGIQQLICSVSDTALAIAPLSLMSATPTSITFQAPGSGGVGTLTYTALLLNHDGTTFATEPSQSSASFTVSLPTDYVYWVSVTVTDGVTSLTSNIQVSHAIVLT